jgi:hypothetical protein
MRGQRSNQLNYVPASLNQQQRAVSVRISNGKSASVELSKFLDSAGVLRPVVPQMSGCVLRNFKSERVAAELFRMLDVVEKMVDERGFEPPPSSLRTRKNLR